MITVQRPNQAKSSNAGSRGVQFLSPYKHVTKAEGHKATIYKVTTDKPDNFGNPYVVYFEMDGQKYSKGFLPTADGLAQLVELFGADEKKWIKKPLVISKSTDEDGGQRLVYLKA